MAALFAEAGPPSVTTSFGILNWAVLLIYLAGMVGIGVWCARRASSTEQFFLAGRRIPWWAAGLSIFGTQLSAITFMAIPATAYAENWVRMLGNIMIMPNGDAYCDGGLWAVDPAILAVAEAFRIRQYCTRPQCDPDYDTSTIRVLSIGTGNATYSLSPPHGDAGALYWAPRVADVMTTSQVQGVQSPLEYLLGDRYQKINFDLPDDTWTLDNTSRIPDLFELGRQAGEEQFDRARKDAYWREALSV